MKPTPNSQIPIDVIDVSLFSYAEKLCAAALQGLVNRNNPRLYLDYGIYDDPTARRTNEDFMDDAIWYGKYRDLIDNQDQHNLHYYQDNHNFQPTIKTTLSQLIEIYSETVHGLVVWDEASIDTVNLALIYCAQNSCLPVNEGLLATPPFSQMEIKHDLRGKWDNRTQLYQWAFTNLFSKCKPGMIVCLEPGWQRTEFVDFVVQEKIFPYSLNSQHQGLGYSLLLLLAFGPPWLREVIFGLRLDGLLRKFGLWWMGKQSPEVALSNQIQRAVPAKPFPTIFGWHTQRDDELSFMLQLSANGLRLVPSHLAGNFSFHSRVKPLGKYKIAPAPAAEALDPQGIYLTFTLSDGDQLMMMHTDQLGNWRHCSRGQVAFNWEVQPLLAELAPALLEKYILQAAPTDCLMAGPSGGGYIIPPLCPTLALYLHETDRLCDSVGIRVVTSYVADPPRRVIKQLITGVQNLSGYLAGYGVLSRTPLYYTSQRTFIANQFPKVEQIWLPADELLKKVQENVEAVKQTPAFIGVHLFAYRTTIADIHNFASTIKQNNIHIVRADQFLSLIHQAQSLRSKDGK